MQKVMILIAVLFGCFVLTACQTTTNKVQPQTAADKVRRGVMNLEYRMAFICKYANHEYGLRITAKRFPGDIITNALNNQADKIRAHCDAVKGVSKNDYVEMKKWYTKLIKIALLEGNSLVDHLYNYGDQYEARLRQYYLCNERVHKSLRAVRSVGLEYSLSSYHDGINQAFSKWEKSRNRACPVKTDNLELAREGFQNRNAFTSAVKRALRGSLVASYKNNQKGKL